MRKLLFFLFPLLLIIIIPQLTKATSLEDCEKDSIAQDKVSDCLTILSNKLSDLGSQKKTLASQIAQFDTQIQLTQAKIADAQVTIDKLEKEIDALGARITNISDSVQKLEVLLKKRIVATYQQSFVSNLELILASRDFSDLILKVQYLRQVQENDRKILSSLQQTKANYAGQKDEREVKQAQIEASKKKLEGLKNSLDQEKNTKQALLTATKNDESRYQRLLAQAQAELAISFGGGTETKVRDVSEGDSIGTVISGASGCSTGTHLHFEVHKNGSIDDPNNYLSSKSFTYPYGESDSGSINPHGSYPWPISDPIYITQGYGMTPYAQTGAYGGKPHFGIDMYSTSLSVRAVHSGELYRGSYQCSNGSLYYSKIKQSDSIDVYYLHMLTQ